MHLTCKASIWLTKRSTILLLTPVWRAPLPLANASMRGRLPLFGSCRKLSGALPSTAPLLGSAASKSWTWLSCFLVMWDLRCDKAVEWDLILKTSRGRHRRHLKVLNLSVLFSSQTKNFISLGRTTNCHSEFPPGPGQKQHWWHWHP